MSRLTLRLGAQSVTLLSTLRDPTQLRPHQCATRQQHPFLPIFFAVDHPLWDVCMEKNSNSYRSSEGKELTGQKKYP